MNEELVSIDLDLARETYNHFLNDSHIDHIAGLIGADRDDASKMIATAVAEATRTLSLLKDVQLFRSSRILEVGAGFGFASLALAAHGLDVTALEPGGLGFDSNRQVAEYTCRISNQTLAYIDMAVEDMSVDDVDQFDLIISNNVLEHVKDVAVVLHRLTSCLHPNGRMVHSCANYVFPFEPHFGVPLVPIWTRTTKYLLPARVRETGLWKSLNFITFFQVRKIARQNHLYASFQKGTMSESFERLRDDVQFAGRHPRLARIARNEPVFRAVRTLLAPPVWLATPMNFELSKSSPVDYRSTDGWKIYEP